MLLMVDVMQEHVQRCDALNQSFFKFLPLLCGKNSWNNVKGNGSLGAATVTINGKGDTNASKHQIGFFSFSS